MFRALAGLEYLVLHCDSQRANGWIPHVVSQFHGRRVPVSGYYDTNFLKNKPIPWLASPSLRALTPRFAF